MILESGNMWDVFGATDMFLITTNPVARRDGAIVMGRGIAKEAKTRYPQLPFDFGYEYAVYPRPVGMIGTYDDQRVGWFMVKNHWREPAQIGIIQQSTDWLRGSMASIFARIDLNFPGIGNGKLKRTDVMPIIEQLPDNVHIWEYKLGDMNAN